MAVAIMRKATVARPAKPAARTVKASASLQKVAQGAAVAVSSMALAFAANADATIKLGADSGALVFEPSSVTIKVLFVPKSSIARSDVFKCQIYINALLSDSLLRRVQAGESVTWVNNAGFPHNIVFDEDEVPVSDPVLPSVHCNSGLPVDQTASSSIFCQLTVLTFPRSFNAIFELQILLCVCCTTERVQTIVLARQSHSTILVPSCILCASITVRCHRCEQLFPLSMQSGANAEALSHEDYMNAPGETYTAKFDTAGTYGYYCEPHQGAGMKGSITVQ